MGADSPEIRGRPMTTWEDKRQEHRVVPAGVLASVCTEDGKRGNTGSPVRHRGSVNWNPVRGRPGWQGGGQVRSTEDAG